MELFNKSTLLTGISLLLASQGAFAQESWKTLLIQKTSFITDFDYQKAAQNALSSTKDFYTKNSKACNIAAGLAVTAVVGYGIYKYFTKGPKTAEVQKPEQKQPEKQDGTRRGDLKGLTEIDLNYYNKLKTEEDKGLFLSLEPSERPFFRQLMSKNEHTVASAVQLIKNQMATYIEMQKNTPKRVK